jgi:hypothetical protein
MLVCQNMVGAVFMQDSTVFGWRHAGASVKAAACVGRLHTTSNFAQGARDALRSLYECARACLRARACACLHLCLRLLWRASQWLCLPHYQRPRLRDASVPARLVCRQKFKCSPLT